MGSEPLAEALDPHVAGLAADAEASAQLGEVDAATLRRVAPAFLFEDA
jgi:hypothetical protein